MPRKTTILIVLLAAITGLLIFLAIRNENSSTQTTVQETPEPTIVTAYATLGFSSGVIDVSNQSATQTVDVLIDTNQKPTAGAQIELSYDPVVFTSVKILPAENPFFGNDAQVLISNVDQKQGRVSYAVGLGANDIERSGTGTVVRLSFTVNKSAGVSSSLITFLDKSAVTTWSSPQSSVLLSASPLQVILVSSSPSIN